MAKTLEQVLKDVYAYVDQSTTLPSAGSTEELVAVNFVNQALREWEDSYDWEQLRKIGTISATLSGTSAALPADFKKLLSPIYDMAQPISTDREYVQIPSSEQYRRQRTDKVTWISGNESGGYYAGFFGLISGFSGVFDYQSTASSLATLSSTAIIPNPNYLVKRTVAFILEARSDSRFPLAKQDAELELRRMIEFADTPSGAEDNRIPDWARSSGFRIGEE